MADQRSDEMGTRVPSERLATSISISWAGLLFFAALLLSYQLGLIRKFEPAGAFEAHNRLHWFRSVAFFWFDRFSIGPSLVLILLICARHALNRRRALITAVLALVTVLLLAVGAYTVREHNAVMHQFVM